MPGNTEKFRAEIEPWHTGRLTHGNKYYNL